MAAAGSILVPDVINGLCLKDYLSMCSQWFHHLAAVSTFQRAYSQLTHSVSGVIRIHSALRSNHERHPYREMLACSLLPQESSTGCPLVLG